jgi:hypothetical protein
VSGLRRATYSAAGAITCGALMAMVAGMSSQWAVVALCIAVVLIALAGVDRETSE